MKHDSKTAAANENQQPSEIDRAIADSIRRLKKMSKPEKIQTLIDAGILKKDLTPTPPYKKLFKTAS